MAQPMICQVCEAEPAVIIPTVVEDGTTIMVGAECLPSFAAGLVESLTGLRLVPTPDQLAQVSAEGAEEPGEEIVSGPPSGTVDGTGEAVPDTAADPVPDAAPKSANGKGSAKGAKDQEPEPEATATADG